MCSMESKTQPVFAGAEAPRRLHLKCLDTVRIPSSAVASASS